AHRVGTNRVAIISRQQPAIGALVGKHVEVVGPKVDHHFLELAFAVNGAKNSRRLQFGGDALWLHQTVLLVIILNDFAVFFVLRVWWVFLISVGGQHTFRLKLP